jgi:predicted nucleotidyltransferase
MHPDLSHYVVEISELCHRFGVRRLEAFGSAARRTDFEPATSDADFRVDFSPVADLPALRQYFGFAEALAALIGRKVDLVSGEIRNPYVLAEFERDRELIFAA